jgi:hypothetical protein
VKKVTLTLMINGADGFPDAKSSGRVRMAAFNDVTAIFYIVSRFSSVLVKFPIPITTGFTT